MQVDEESAANSLFSELLLKAAQAARLVEGVRDGRSDPFLDAEWILIMSLVEYFRNGMPPLRKGSTLRLFLAKLLNRDPMAITKKFQYEEMELGLQTFEPQDVDSTKEVRTFRDQVAAFVASQQDRPYLGVHEEKSQSKNPWRAHATIPVEYGGEKKHLGCFPTKKEAACAHDAFIEDDYRFNAKYVREKSNCIKYKKDFKTMDDEMKAAQAKGRSKAEEAPGRLRHRPAAAPAPARKPKAQKRRRTPTPQPTRADTRADEAKRRAAQEPPRVLEPVPTTTPPVPAGTPADPAGAVLTQLGVGTVDPFANCAVARALLRVAQAARPDAGRIRFGTWPDEELDLVAAFVAQFQYRTLPLKRGSLLRTFLSEVLNCEGMRITKKFAGDSSFGKQVFVLPQQNFDLADVAQRLAPLVEAFIQAPQARSRPSSPRAVPAPAPPPPPPLPEGVPPPPANVAQPVAAPAPAAAAPGVPMTDD